MCVCTGVLDIAPGNRSIHPNPRPPNQQPTHHQPTTATAAAAAAIHHKLGRTCLGWWWWGAPLAWPPPIIRRCACCCSCGRARASLRAAPRSEENILSCVVCVVWGVGSVSAVCVGPWVVLGWSIEQQPIGRAGDRSIDRSMVVGVDTSIQTIRFRSPGSPAVDRPSMHSVRRVCVVTSQGIRSIDWAAPGKGMHWGKRGIIKVRARPFPHRKLTGSDICMGRAR